MSGLFQRIARRRSDDASGDAAPQTAAGASAPPPAGEPAGAQPPADATPGADAAAEQPTRFIGLPADQAAPAEPAPSQQPAVDPAPAVAEQPTVLFPLVPDQPTVEHDTVPEETTAAISAAAAGSTPLGVGALPAPAPEQQPVVAQQTAAGESAEAAQPAQPEAERRPGFRERGRMRRRLRYLRRLRELQVRDLGGLAFDLRRFERKRDDLIAQKIDQIRACDDELRALETALDERRDVRDVRLPGIGGTCPRCFSLYGSNDRFCAHCGAALGGLAQGPAQVASPLPPPPAPASPAAAPSTPTAPPPPQ
jgi:hypothetical protein